MAHPLQRFGSRWLWLRASWKQQQTRPFSSSMVPPPIVSELPSAIEARPPAPLPWALGLFQLMAVPKRKVSRSKKGIRNGPKALKPQPVIIRCKCCGRVRLPHFFCCPGERNV